MKVTNYVLTNLLVLLEKYSEKKLPQRISYAIGRNIVILTKEYSIYEKQLHSIIKNFDEYIIKDENGNFVMNSNGIPIVDDNMKDKYFGEINELLNIEIDIEMYYISQDVFDYDNNEMYDPLSAQDIITLQSVLCKNE